MPARAKLNLIPYVTGTECVYREKGQPGLRPGYGKSVEQRLKAVEEDIAEVREKLRNSDVVARSLATPSLANPPPRPIAKGSLDGLWADPNALSEGTVVPPLSPSFARVTCSIHAPYQHSPVSSALSAEGTWRRDLDRDLPSADDLAHLVDLFFEYTQPTTRLFHEPTFRRDLFSPERQLLLHAITVISFRHWTRPLPTLPERDRYVKRSREKLLLSAAETCTMVSTQALTLLAVDAVGHGPSPRTWTVMSILMAAARQLTLAVDATCDTVEMNPAMVTNHDTHSFSAASHVEEEERRRLFWNIYTLDRFTSLCHGVPCGIEPRSIRQRFPSVESDWDKASTADWFQPAATVRAASKSEPCDSWRCLLDVLALLDRTHQFLLQPLNLTSPTCFQEWQSKFRALDAALTAWSTSLPARDSSPQLRSMWIMTHAAFQM